MLRLNKSFDVVKHCGISCLPAWTLNSGKINVSERVEVKT